EAGLAARDRRVQPAAELGSRAHVDLATDRDHVGAGIHVLFHELELGFGEGHTPCLPDRRGPSQSIRTVLHLPDRCEDRTRTARIGLAGAASGGGGIRTRGPRERTPVFKTGAFDRSATPPSRP